MEDSTAMTIEFLRARLLSERSVSRRARQRADELAKRVMELEKQLKIVCLQRKKAEKATADVLAILENHGTSDVSETFGSSSDADSKVGASSVKGEETSSNVKVGENDVETFSGSELESSSVNGRSLSWKSNKDSLCSLEKKYMGASRRRRNSFTSSGSSPKRVGKSCRQIRRREHRSAVEEVQNDASTNAHREDEVATSSEGVHNFSDIGPQTSREGSENREEKDLPEVPVSAMLDNHRSSNGHYLSNNGGDKDMERALEYQAQLIGRYEAEEKAQREWEDKFRENNSSTPDSCDPGNHSDVTEERDDIKAPAPPFSTEIITSQSQAPELGEEPKIDTQDQKYESMISSKSPPSESAFSVAKGKNHEGYPDNHRYPQMQGSYHSPDLSGTSKNNSTHVSSSKGSSLYKGEAAGKTNEFALMTRENENENSGKLGSVLEALQQAKLSLKQNMNSVPLLESGSIHRAIEPSFTGARDRGRFSLPIGSAGLFRLPTDYQYEATTRANLIGLDNRVSMTNYSPDPAGTRFFSSPYTESRSGVSMDDRYLTIPTFPYPEARSDIPGLPSSRLDQRLRPSIFEPRLDPGLPSSRLDQRLRPSIFEPRLDPGLPSSSNRYIGLDPHSRAGLPSASIYTHTTHPSYQEPMPRMPTDGRPPSTRFSFYDDYTRPNMYS